METNDTTQLKMNKPKEKLEALLRTMVLAICRNTTNLEVKFWDDAAKFTVKVAGDDQGRAIGKKGRTIWAITTIIWYAGLKEFKKPIGVGLDEQRDGKPRRPVLAFKANAQWDKKILNRVIDTILENCFEEKIPWVMESVDETTSLVKLQLPHKHFATMSEPGGYPSFEEAFRIIIHSAGMAGGAVVNTEAEWK